MLQVQARIVSSFVDLYPPFLLPIIPMHVEIALHPQGRCGFEPLMVNVQKPGTWECKRTSALEALRCTWAYEVDCCDAILCSRSQI
jgi:hypothetical protein